MKNKETLEKLRTYQIGVIRSVIAGRKGRLGTYCADEAEALQTLNQIIKIEGIRSIFCCDKELRSFLDVVKTQYTNDLELYNDAAFITCEYLIAFDGRIMLSHNNILHYHV